MKETLAEYARIIIVGISFALMIAFLFGGIWFNRLGDMSNSMGNEVVQEKQQSILDKMDNMYPPQINVVGQTFKTGQLIKLQYLVKEAYSEEITESGSKVKTDLKDRVEISCDHTDYHPESQSLVPLSEGIYEVEYSVTDDYGQTTRKTIYIVAEN